MVDGLESGTAISAYLVVQDCGTIRLGATDVKDNVGPHVKFNIHVVGVTSTPARSAWPRRTVVFKQLRMVKTVTVCHGVVKKELGGHVNRH